MALRACVYKNCESYTLHGVSSPEKVTLFQFPKDAERRRIWMNNGQVPSSCPSNALHMCSLHFEQKFLCVNNRRTILFAHAIPNVYVEVNDSANKAGMNNIEDIEENSNCFAELETAKSQDSDVDSFTEEFSSALEESSNKKEHYQKLLLNVARKEPETPYIALQDHQDTQYIDIKKVNVKRKADSPVKKYMTKKNIGTSSNTVASTTINVCQSSAEITDDGIMDTDATDWSDNIVDAAHVTTFIFKGEEYVQMPKNYYVREKSNLLKNISSLETKIKHVKDSVNTILETND